LPLSRRECGVVPRARRRPRTGAQPLVYEDLPSELSGTSSLGRRLESAPANLEETADPVNRGSETRFRMTLRRPGALGEARQGRSGTPPYRPRYGRSRGRSIAPSRAGGWLKASFETSSYGPRPVKWCTTLSAPSSPDVHAAAAIAITSSGSSTGASRSGKMPTSVRRRISLFSRSSELLLQTCR
jgi:hypothetical protein